MFNIPFQSCLLIEYSYMAFESIRIGLHGVFLTFSSGFNIQQLISLRVFMKEARCLEIWNG